MPSHSHSIRFGVYTIAGALLALALCPDAARRLASAQQRAGIPCYVDSASELELGK